MLRKHCVPQLQTSGCSILPRSTKGGDHARENLSFSIHHSNIIIPMYQCEWEVIIREYTDVEGTGSIAAEVYVFDQATGQKRTVTTMTLDGENDLNNATYNPQNQTIVVTRSAVDGGKNT